MKKQILVPSLALAALIIVSLACGTPSTPPPAPTQPPPPTQAPVQVQPTQAPPTEPPTAEPTIDLAATQQVESWQADLQMFDSHGYLDSTAGDFKGYDNFEESWAQLGWYKWWILDEVDSDFVFGAHMKWDSATSTPETSGCGIVFGTQSNDDHYAVVLDKSRILFLMGRGSNIYNVGKTSGPGRTNFGNPAEADFQVLVKDQKAYVAVDGEITTYTLSMDQSTRGSVGLTVLSGTNRDYGTHCEMTNIHIWTPSK